MIAIAPFPIKEAPSARPESAPPPDNDSDAHPFDAFLSGASNEKAEYSSQRPSETQVPSGEDEGEEKKPDQDSSVEDAADQGDADTTVLSSCLAMWQIFPSTTSTEIPAGELGSEIVQEKNLTGEVLEGAVVPAALTEPNEVTSSAPGSDATPAEPSVAQQGTATSIPTAKTPRAPQSEPAAKPLEIKDLQPSGEANTNPRAELDGIPVAKEHRAMPESVLQPTTSSAPAAFAEPGTGAETTLDAGQNGLQAGAFEGGQSNGDSAPGDNGNSPHHDSPFDVSSLNALHRPAHESGSDVTVEKMTVADASQALQRVERAIEHLRMNDGQRMELHLSLRTGEEVVVKLRLEQGEVKVAFQTNSEGLRQALENGWSHLVQNSSDRTVKLGPAVFESGSTQNNTGGFPQSGHQQGHGQHPHDSESAHFPLPGNHSGNNPRPLPDPRRTPVAAPSVGNLQIYA